MTNNPRGDLAVRITVACGILGTIAVTLRLFVRWKSKAPFAADDYTILAALAASYAMEVCGSLMITLGGAGRHVSDLSLSQLTIVLKTINAYLFAYTLTLAIAKISILLLYRRIFITPAFKTATLVVGGAILAWAVAAILCFIFQFNPISELWNPRIAVTSSRINLHVYYNAFAALNITFDFIVLCLPLWMVWHLALDTRKRLMLSGIFALGTLTCFASLARIISIHLEAGDDITHDLIVPYIFGQIEPTMSIICACLITYRPLFKNLDFASLNPLSRSKQSSGSQRLPGTPRDSNRAKSWPAMGTKTSEEDVHGLEELNRKVGRGEPHIVNVAAGPDWEASCDDNRLLPDEPKKTRISSARWELELKSPRLQGDRRPKDLIGV